jgi:hypothetical protein
LLHDYSWLRSVKLVLDSFLVGIVHLHVHWLISYLLLKHLLLLSYLLIGVVKIVSLKANIPGLCLIVLALHGVPIILLVS